jgi:hypothetical protein
MRKVSRPLNPCACCCAILALIVSVILIARWVADDVAIRVVFDSPCH